MIKKIKNVVHKRGWLLWEKNQISKASNNKLTCGMHLLLENRKYNVSLDVVTK